MSAGTSQFLLGAIVGILGALLYVYWKQIMYIQKNAGTIGDVTNIITSAQNLVQKL